MANVRPITSVFIIKYYLFSKGFSTVFFFSCGLLAYIELCFHGVKAVMIWSYGGTVVAKRYGESA